MKPSLFSLCILIMFFLCTQATDSLARQAQDKVVIDRVIAVVGNSPILKSDVINQVRELEAQNVSLGPDPFCAVLNEALYQKLLFNQAMIDSVEVSDDRVEQVLERRLRFFIQQIGSRERLEAYYGKTVDELKDEFREVVREQELSQQMEQEITKNVSITPAEVRRFFNQLPPDSIPMVESEIMLAKIKKVPPVRQEETDEVKSRLQGFRERVLQGERFSTLAILYSEDPGSARNGGELGFRGRGELFPQFEAVAFGLRPGEVSEVVETPAGYHIIQMIERRGEQINVRHILIQPKVSPEDALAVRNELDSIRTIIQDGEMTFAEAALKFSEHPGRINQGLMVNPFTGTNRFRSEDLEPSLFFVIDGLDVGEVSEPLPTSTEEGRTAYKIVSVRSRRDAQVANMQDDYDYIQQMALQQKKRQAVDRWVRRRLQSTYVFIHPDHHHCSFDFGWIKQGSQTELE